MEGNEIVTHRKEKVRLYIGPGANEEKRANTHINDTPYSPLETQ